MIRLSRGTFTKLLIGKSICEGLLVAAVAVGLFVATGNRALRGALEQADSQTISGWAVDQSNPARHVEVQLFIDDNFVEQKTAGETRPAVRQANRSADDRHGFVFKTPLLSAGEHEARVYIVHSGSSLRHRTLQIVGEPIKFRSDALP